MSLIASQITSLTIVYWTVYSDADQRKHQSSASLAFVWGIHRGPVYSPHKWPVTRKMFPFDEVIMYKYEFKMWYGWAWINLYVTFMLNTWYSTTKSLGSYLSRVHICILKWAANNGINIWFYITGQYPDIRHLIAACLITHCNYVTWA